MGSCKMSISRFGLLLLHTGGVVFLDEQSEDVEVCGTWVLNLSNSAYVLICTAYRCGLKHEET
jgi:hypothetical protein